MLRCGSALSRAVVPLAAVCAFLVVTAPPAGAGTDDTDGSSLSTTCATFGQGTSGAAVETIQTLIGTPADGDFGPHTGAALKTWQGSHDLPVTGVVDDATWAAMPADTAATACGQKLGGTGFTVSCATLSQGDVGLAVDVLEAALKQPVDGQFSAGISGALAAAQKAAGLTANGVTDRATWKVLSLTSTPVCTRGSNTPPLPKDYKAQQKVRKQVVKLAATLVEQPGTTTNKIALAAIDFEKAQIGTPYVYGGVGPKGYDCSGLQMTSYQHAGLTLPRVAADQYAGSGPTVPLDQAQAGDLIFYATDVLKPATIYHVAMYVGGGQSLDAPHTGAKVGLRSLGTTDLLPLVVRPVAGLTLPLRNGATGWSVTQLQRMLNRLGVSVPVDGGYGPQTRAAVKSWQQSHQIKPSGVVGLGTWLTFLG